MQRFSGKILRTVVFIGTPLLLAAWVCYFYPWLECMENESFFCFLPSWLGSFFAWPGGFSELLARFFVQFFCRPAAMVAVLAIIGLLLFFSVRAYARRVIPQRTGRFRPFLCFIVGLVLFLPFWFLAYRNLDGFRLAVGVWFNMLAVWACLGLLKPCKGKKVIIRLFLFLVIEVLLYHLTGPVSLLYVLLGLLLRPWFGLSGVALYVLTAWLSSLVFVYPIQTSFLPRFPENNADLALQRVFAQSECWAEKQQWNRIVKTASIYFDKHQQPSVNADIDQLRTRELLAVNLKLALLKSGRLNRQFFSYNHVYEMNMMMAGRTFAGEYNFSNMRFAWHLGLFVPMRIYTNNILNVAGLQNATLRMIIPNAIFLQRYDLAANYIYFLRHTLFYTEQASRWQGSNGAEASEQNPFFAVQRRINTSRMQEEPGTDLDSWVEMMYTSMSGKDVLEYHTFLQLFYKNIEELPALAEHYRRLGYKTLPDYVQEGLLILQDYEPETDTVPETYSGYAYSPTVLAVFKRARQDQKLHQMGVMDVNILEKNQGSTYFFHYYFRRFLYQ